MNAATVGDISYPCLSELNGKMRTEKKKWKKA
jgi:hypothetical protein